MSTFHKKYLKYKAKYLALKRQYGGCYYDKPGCLECSVKAVLRFNIIKHVFYYIKIYIYIKLTSLLYIKKLLKLYKIIQFYTF